VLYRELNWALRNDDASLDKWASYLTILFHGGEPTYCPGACPEDALPQEPQVTYRGFSMDGSLVSRYKKGDTFFWQTFVSTSKLQDQSLEFARKKVPEGQKSFLFSIDVPKYAKMGKDAQWAYELQGVSVYKEEDEVLLLPYTMFEVKEAPTEADDGIVHVPIRMVMNPLIKMLDNITIWLDPNGFQQGNNKVLAHHAFMTTMPCFRLNEHGNKDDPGNETAYGRLRGGIQALGLFTDTEAALKFAAEMLRMTSAIVFKLAVSGGASQKFLGQFFERFPWSPCNVMVFCGDEEKWKGEWSHAPRVQVTNNQTKFKTYLQHLRYVKQQDEFLPLDKVADSKAAIDEKKKCYYSYRNVEGGVVYGSCGSIGSQADKDTKGKFLTGFGNFPDVPMGGIDKEFPPKAQ